MSVSGSNTGGKNNSPGVSPGVRNGSGSVSGSLKGLSNGMSNLVNNGGQNGGGNGVGNGGGSGSVCGNGNGNGNGGGSYMEALRSEGEGGCGSVSGSNVNGVRTGARTVLDSSDRISDRIKGAHTGESGLITVLEGLVGGLDLLVLSLRNKGEYERLKGMKGRLIECFTALGAEVYGVDIGSENVSTGNVSTACTFGGSALGLLLQPMASAFKLSDLELGPGSAQPTQSTQSSQDSNQNLCDKNNYEKNSYERNLHEKNSYEKNLCEKDMISMTAYRGLWVTLTLFRIKENRAWSEHPFWLKYLHQISAMTPPLLSTSSGIAPKVHTDNNSHNNTNNSINNNTIVHSEGGNNNHTKLHIQIPGNDTNQNQNYNQNNNFNQNFNQNINISDGELTAPSSVLFDCTTNSSILDKELSYNPVLKGFFTPSTLGTVGGTRGNLGGIRDKKMLNTLKSVVRFNTSGLSAGQVGTV